MKKINKKRIRKNENLLLSPLKKRKYIKGEYISSNKLRWLYNLSKLKKFIIECNRLPVKSDDKKLLMWLVNQKYKYKRKIKIMSEEKYIKKWENLIKDKRFKHLFLSYEERWYRNFNILKQYVNKHNELPRYLNMEYQYLYNWIKQQNYNYINQSNAMKKKEIYELWHNFKNKNKYLFLSSKELWFINYNLLINYINKYNKLPKKNSSGPNKNNLYKWYKKQEHNFNNYLGLMRTSQMIQIWEEYKNKYKFLYLTKEEKWIQNFNNFKAYIIKHNKKPSSKRINNTNKSLYEWYIRQNHNNKNLKGLMNNKRIFNIWNNFIKDEKYKHLFLTNEEKWYIIYNEFENYVFINNKVPDSSNKKYYYLYNWYLYQNNNYYNNKGVMKNFIIKNKWKKINQFIFINNILLN